MRQTVIQILTPITWKLVSPSVMDGRCVMVCDQLGLTVEAESTEDARPSLESAMKLLLEDLTESGEFDGFCKERGLECRILEREENPNDITVSAPVIRIKSDGHDALPH